MFYKLCYPTDFQDPTLVRASVAPTTGVLMTVTLVLFIQLN